MVSNASAPVEQAGPGLRHLRFDVGTRPFLVLFELTRACNLACRHCRAEAIPQPEADDLSTQEVQSVIDDLASLGSPRPIVVLTGGDPLARSDLTSLVRYGAERGLAMSVAPAGTPRASFDRMSALRQAGAGAVSFSVDGGDADTHDDFRRVAGSFEWTLAGWRAARQAGLRVQVNTVVSSETVRELPTILRLVAEREAHLWSVFFLVPVGRARPHSPLSARDTEDVLAFLRDAAAFVPLKTTEAPSFRRVLLQGRNRHLDETAYLSGRGDLYRYLRNELDDLEPVLRGAATRRNPQPAATGSPRRAPLAVGDGRGVVFVSRRGDVQPSGFLPLVVGNVRDTPLSVIYSESSLLRDLRDPDALTGRCGRCEYRRVCGGSRAQAYADSGNPLGEDPTCAYDP